jgi:asparagine synthase (glutamine-hydrolysing)
VNLGQRRLAILDAPGGRQPMWNEDDTVGIVFNGEIYNYAGLRAELVAKGHIFISDHSDTETLVHGYEEWGLDLLPRLNGMFAFAIYDRRRKQIVLAVDRFSEKPLYYTTAGPVFAFASELVSLLRHPCIRPSVSPVAVQKYFAYGYFPAPYTLYEGVAKLAPGEALVYHVESGQRTLTSWWNFALQPDHALTDRDEPRLIEELRHLLQQAVTRRLISDVPLGVFLSGGIDSSAIVMAAAKASAAPIETFTIGFEEPSFDESSHARLVAEYFHTHHHERVLDKSAGFSLIPEVLGRLSEPLGDASIIPTYMVSAFTRQHVTVALSGDGGDELFGGYDPFKALAPAGLYRRFVPGAVHRGMRALAERLPVSTANMALDFRIKRVLRGLSYTPALWNPVWMSPLAPDEIAAMFEHPLAPEELYSEAIAAWNRPGAGDTIDRTLEFFTKFYLPADILTKSDRAAMMVSLEARAIFLDNDLVAFCEKLPNRFKFRNGRGKYLLRKALEGQIPDSILNRPKKGFGVPLTKWLRDLPEEGLHAIPGMRHNEIDRLWQEHREGKADHRLFLWSLLSMSKTIEPPLS